MPHREHELRPRSIGRPEETEPMFLQSKPNDGSSGAPGRSLTGTAILSWGSHTRASRVQTTEPFA
eukprot:14326726-Alexandrium_andersonii.AAC.1